MKIRTSIEIVTTKLDNEITILNIQTGKYFSLNDVGSRIWELMIKLGDTGDILEALMREYDIDKEILNQDILSLLQKLTEAGLITTE